MKLQQIQEVYRKSGRSLQRITRVLFILTIAFMLMHSSFGSDGTGPERELFPQESLNDSLLWINPACDKLPDDIGRRFVKLKDNSIMTFVYGKTRISEDAGKTWSKPVVIARKKGAWLSYSYIFEPEPGILWLTTGQGDLRLRAREKDLIKY